MLSPCCRERTEHPSSSGGMVVMLAGGVRAPMLCSAVEHSLLRAGMTPADWGSDLGPGPGSRLPARSFHQQIWATSMWASSSRMRCCCAYTADKQKRMLWRKCGGRFASVSEIPARPLWLQACQSDLGGLNHVSCRRPQQQQQCTTTGAPYFLQDTGLKYLFPSPMG